jgi:hypothetical protein
MTLLDAWALLVDAWALLDTWAPSLLDKLYFFEILCITVFSVIAIIMGYVHHNKLDLYRILRNGIGGGATFPPAIALTLYPVSGPIRVMFNADVIKGALMIGGATSVVLILYGLFKK